MLIGDYTGTFTVMSDHYIRRLELIIRIMTERPVNAVTSITFPYIKPRKNNWITLPALL